MLHPSAKSFLAFLALTLAVGDTLAFSSHNPTPLAELLGNNGVGGALVAQPVIVQNVNQQLTYVPLRLSFGL